MKNQNLPNIFEFATSELSQDAFFAWLIKCASPQYLTVNEELCKLGQSFVNLLIGKNNFQIEKIEVGRQWKNIDIWIEVNDDIFIAIEDKTETTEHDKQLERYKDIVHEEYDGHRDNLFFVYIKTGNEPKTIINKISEGGYNVILRDDLLNILKNYKGKHAFVLDYKDHLQKIEDETQKFNKAPVTEWGWYAWQGFYQEINKYIDLASWSYVANPSGGFLGAYWYFIGIDEKIEMYLQFEEQKLCFKIWCGYENRSEIRNKLYEILLNEKEGKFSDSEIIVFLSEILPLRGRSDLPSSHNRIIA